MPSRGHSSKWRRRSLLRAAAYLERRGQLVARSKLAKKLGDVDVEDLRQPVELMGTVFDLRNGTVRFYAFWLRRRVALADIRDANCEFGIPVSPTRLIFGLFGQKGRRGRSEARQRSYMVNLSGSFGSRQIRFHHKRWRDRFLSILRDQASRCRITRWF